MPLRLLSRVKGDLSLRFPDRAYRGGDLLDLSLTIRTRTRFGRGRLYVAIVCTETVQQWHTASDGTRSMRTDRQQLLRDEIEVRNPVQFGAGRTEIIRMMTEVPDPWRPQDRGDDTPSHLAQLRRVRNATMAYDRTVQWSIEGHLDIPGLNLVDRKPIDVQVQRPVHR